MNSIQASQIMGGNGAKARKAADLYPTPPEVTVALMRFLKLPGETVVWEPARGEGDMVRALANCGMAVYGTDIRDGIDFLTARQPGNAPAADWIITNPPFSLADEFIRHAAEIGKPFAMLLKAQYWHAAKRAQLFREIPPSYVLPLTWRPDFLFKERNGKKGTSPLMDVMWCVWLTPQMQGVQTVFAADAAGKGEMSMFVGETYSWVPTSWEGSNGIVSALGKKGGVHGRIVYINENHRYFTAEANVGGVVIRESFKF